MENHDLSLPSWGPYNKEYLGASHVTDPERGLRFDLNLFPGYYRRSVVCPRDLADCGVKIMASSADVSHYIYRYELEWKDKVYIDADFCSVGDTLKVKCSFVNNTDMPESLTLNALVSMRAASLYHNEIVDYKAVTADGCLFVDAVDYDRAVGDYVFPRDGLRLFEKRGSGFVLGRAETTQKMSRGTELFYKIPATLADKMAVRYKGEGRFCLKANGNTYPIVLDKKENIGIFTFELPLGELSEFSLAYESGECEIDGFVIGKEVEKTEFVPAFDCAPTSVKQSSSGLSVSYGEYTYDISVEGAELFLRTLITDDPGQLLTASIHNHTSSVIKGVGDRVYRDIFARPIFVMPNSCAEVIITVKASNADATATDPTVYEPVCNPEGEKYCFSQKIMSATTLTNVVYPTYCRGKYIKHNTPGRNWDSLYTWDSGFIGLGLLTMDQKRAEECLNAYLMPEGNGDSPFVLHGTPLPTQILLYAELVNKTCDKALAERYYKRIKEMYEFFSAQKAQNDSGIFSLWHLFYNSGGWDDYPTQKLLHAEKKEESVCPVVNTAFTLLCARILAPIARLIGEDDSLYLADIEFFSNALNKHAWDEESGYYGYTQLSEGKTSIYKTMGVNADMGMDGAYPYIAGACDQYRGARILENVKEGMMTEIGVSVVDLRAPYFKKSGYWNGSVWMPHQWILWKALLDYGETELATKIAETALSLWERETSTTLNCYEHFMIENGRGAGFHQFSGLSTPVLMWFESYYRPYSLSGGFGALISEKKQEDDGLSFKVTSESPCFSVIACLKEGSEYSFDCEAEVKPINKGAYSLTFKKAGEYSVKIEKC